MIYGRKHCDTINGCGKFYNQFLDVCPHCNTPEAFADFKPYNPLDWIYDLENYPNIFTADFKHPATRTRQLFEISDRRNDGLELYNFLNSMAGAKCRMVGFNNLGYDYPIIHFFIQHFNQYFNVADLYAKNEQIINTPWEKRFDNVIWDNDRYIEQIDLYKIHHFDNESRRTSLKMLEFNMRSDNIQDLPFEPGTILNNQEKNELIIYNDSDVNETEKFYFESLEMIEFREQLTKKHGRNFLNHSDKKIGTDLFIAALEQAAPGSCYTYNTAGKRIPRQTIRNGVALKDCIFPYIKFKEPEFNRVLQWLKTQVISQTKGELGASATVKGFTYPFGAGGIHVSTESTVICSDDEYVIFDWDVKGYYPEVGTANKLYPEHLSEQFCIVNEALKEERKKYDKGTALNKSIKLSRNGAFGDSAQQHSPFLDIKYFLSITINGQLLLCMLAQYLIDIPGLQMIQMNTDGLTVRCPRRHVDIMIKICEWWQSYTCLELEHEIYSRMFIRDVNNYIAEYDKDKKLKRKGAYCHERVSENPGTQELEWHKNHSALVIPKAAEAALVHGQDIRDFIEKHDDIFDFMLRTKVNRQDKLVMRDIFGNEKRLQRISRYYISNATDAGALVKISPPAKGYHIGQWRRANSLTDEFYLAVRHELQKQDLSHVLPHDIDATGLPWDERINTKSKTKYKMRETKYHVSYFVRECNNIKNARRHDINIDYYVTETEKLVNPLRNVI